MRDQGPDEAPERVYPGEGRESDRPEGPLDWLQWGLRTEHPTVQFVREVVASVLGVLLVGALLFAISGIWPPLVAVESESMSPHMHTGDLVFVMEEHRLAPSFAAGSTGVVTYRDAVDRDAYRKFGDHGDVIVFYPDGGGSTPIIHRARFWVEDGENWVSKADPAYLPGTECEVDDDPETDTGLPNCPAPHAGFITKGDANGAYDQVANGNAGRVISSPVRPAWIRGTAEVRIPWLGYVRLYFSRFSSGSAAGTEIHLTNASVAG